MSNTVYNLIQVNGPEEDLRAVSKAIQNDSSGLSYTNKKGSQDFFGGDAKWEGYKPGKANPFEFHVTRGWGPPYDVIEEASKDFPKLTFDVFYAGQGPVAGMARFQNGIEIIDMAPETLEDYKDLVDSVRYQYPRQTPEEFAEEKRELVEEITEGLTFPSPVEPVPPDSDAPVVGIWLTLIGAMTAYSYFKNR